MADMDTLDPDSAAATFITVAEVVAHGPLELTVARQDKFEENRLSDNKKVNVIVLQINGNSTVQRLLPLQRFQVNQLARARNARKPVELAGLKFWAVAGKVATGQFKGASLINVVTEKP